MNKKFKKICIFYLLMVVVLMQLSFDLGGMSLNRIYADGADNEIIRNGDFSGGSSQWLLFVDWAANASAYNIVTADTEGNSISRTGVTHLGDYDWSVKLYQKDITIENSKKYILSFDAWSSVNREIKIRIEGGTNYTTYFERTLNLETSKKEYSFEFVMNHPTDLTSQLAFNFGHTNSLEEQFHNIYIDNVSLIMLDSEPIPTSTPEPTVEPIPTHWPPYPWPPYPLPTQPAESDNIQSSINLSRNTLSTVDFGRIVNMEFVQEGSLSVEGTIEAPKEIVMVLDNSGTFNSYIKNVPWPLDFGIYAHETLSIEGYEVNIDGSTYSRDFISTSNSLRITEKCSSFSTHITSPIIDVGEFENLTIPVEMPHFDAELMRDVIVFEPRDYMDEREKPMPGQEGITIRYDKDKKQFEILADTSTTFNIDSSMYFKGGLLISLIETKNINDSFLLADGDIIVQGTNFRPSGPDDKLFMYSKKGNISIETTNSQINGIMYAPGDPKKPETGRISFLGNNNIINGSLAARNFNFTASNLQVNNPKNKYEGIKEEYFQGVNYLYAIKNAAKSFVDRFVGTKTKIGIIQYSDSANNNDFKLYDLSLPENAEKLKRKIDKIESTVTGESNMGDGIRRAKYLLNDPHQTLPYASKHMVVLVGSAPNKWTSNNLHEERFMLEDGRALFLKGDGTIDSDGKALEYAKTVAENLTDENIIPTFIDFSSEDNDIENQLDAVATSSGAKLVSSTGKHFYKADSISKLSGIYDNIYMKTIFDTSLNSVTFEKVFPSGVLVTEIPENMVLEEVIVDGEVRQKLTGTINNILFSFDGSKYILSNMGFKVRVKYTEVGEILYEGSDAKMTYMINYIDGKGNEQLEILEEHFEDMIVNSVFEIDIN
ncbi:MAG: VWA domain-containing protein [Clostridium sp.]|jgi:hypothetical protein|nr:VWA domain-containing protein [Clostridium sp.]